MEKEKHSMITSNSNNFYLQIQSIEVLEGKFHSEEVNHTQENTRMNNTRPTSQKGAHYNKRITKINKYCSLITQY